VPYSDFCHGLLVKRSNYLVKETFQVEHILLVAGMFENVRAFTCGKREERAATCGLSEQYVMSSLVSGSVLFAC
jgi:hypothetical protein